MVIRLTESGIKRIIRTVINERLEIENYMDDIDDNVHNLIDFNASGGGFTQIEFMGKPIEVYVSNSDTYSGSFFAWRLRMEFPKSNPDFNTVKEIFIHELTHKINDKLPNRRGRYFPGVSDYSWYVNKIRDILYRLWNRDERIAYLCRSIQGVAESKRYIERLRKEIDEIENPPENYSPDIEGLIWANMVSQYNAILPNKTPLAQKNFFIKKSRYLLSRFEEKLMKNAYRFEYEKKGVH